MLATCFQCELVRHRLCACGQTGDVVRDWNHYYFEPHNDDPDALHIGRVKIDMGKDISALNQYQPKRTVQRTFEDCVA